MKRNISKILRTILFIIGLPFFMIDCVVKNKLCERVIDKINDKIYDLTWWGTK